MKKMNKLSRIQGQLDKLFDKLNDKWYGGELPKPVITIQASSKSYAHISVDPIWALENSDGAMEARRELNISATYLSRDLSEIASSLLHEMAHIFCMENGIRDTSRAGNSYHNKRFKEVAESHGICVEYNSNIGWSITSPSDELIEWLLDEDFEDLKMCRADIDTISRIVGTGGSSANNTGDSTKVKKKSSSIKIHCPSCGCIARITKPTVRLICADCMELMVEA